MRQAPGMAGHGLQRAALPSQPLAGWRAGASRQGLAGCHALSNRYDPPAQGKVTVEWTMDWSGADRLLDAGCCWVWIGLHWFGLDWIGPACQDPKPASLLVGYGAASFVQYSVLTSHNRLASCSYRQLIWRGRQWHNRIHAASMRHPWTTQAGTRANQAPDPPAPSRPCHTQVRGTGRYNGTC